MGSSGSILDSNKELDETERLDDIIDLIKKQILKELGYIHENELEKMNYTQNDDDKHRGLYNIEFISSSLGKTKIKFSRKCGICGICSIHSNNLRVESQMDYRKIIILNNPPIFFTSYSRKSGNSKNSEITFSQNNVFYSNNAFNIFRINYSNIIIPENKLFPCIKKGFRYPNYREEEFEKTFAKLGYIDKEINGPSTLEELKKVCEKMNIEYELEINNVIDNIMSHIKLIFIL